MPMTRSSDIRMHLPQGPPLLKVWASLTNGPPKFVERGSYGSSSRHSKLRLA